MKYVDALFLINLFMIAPWVHGSDFPQRKQGGAVFVSVIRFWAAQLRGAFTLAACSAHLDPVLSSPLSPESVLVAVFFMGNDVQRINSGHVPGMCVCLCVC